MRHTIYPHDKLLARIILPLIPDFITPNAVTVLRFILTPSVVYFLIVENYRVAIPLFIIAAFTDALDGSLARVRDKITPWGTVYDPVADKLLIGACILVLVMRHLDPIIAATIILLELLFLAGGFLYKRRGIIESPSWWGKSKMIFQVIGVTLMLVAVSMDSSALLYISSGAFIIAIVLAVINIIRYGLTF